MKNPTEIHLCYQIYLYAVWEVTSAFCIAVQEF